MYGIEAVPRWSRTDNAMIKRCLKMVLPKSLIRCIRHLADQRKEVAAYQLKLQPYRQLTVQKDSTETQLCLAKLRMYAHVVDKGLQRHDWESGHSMSAYAKAVHYLQLCPDTEDPTYRWARGIVAEYDKGRAEQCARPGNVEGQWHYTAPVDAARLMAFLKFRTSIRCFQKKLVPEETASMIAEAALEAPSSCHRQTLKIYGSVNPKSVGTIAGCFHGFTGFSEFVPLVLVFCADLRPYTYPVELFTPTVDTALAVENAMLMASALGITMTLLNWIGKPESEQRLRACLEIPLHEAIVIGAVGGYPSAAAPRPIRKPVSRTLILK